MTSVCGGGAHSRSCMSACMGVLIGQPCGVGTCVPGTELWSLDVAASPMAPFLSYSETADGNSNSRVTMETKCYESLTPITGHTMMWLPLDMAGCQGDHF